MPIDQVFEALAHPARRQILDLLKQEGELAAGALAEQFDLTKPTMSHHLATLLNAGLVDRERRGRFLYYRVNLSVLEEALQIAMNLLSFGPRPAGREEKS